LVEIPGFSTATLRETWDGLGVGADKLTRGLSRIDFHVNMLLRKTAGSVGRATLAQWRGESQNGMRLCPFMIDWKLAAVSPRNS